MRIGSPHQEKYECRDNKYAHHPPEPTHTMREHLLRAELPFNILPVVEVLLGQTQRISICFFRPPGLIIRTAFRTCLRIAWNFGATIGTDLRGHSIPAYSSSVFRFTPMRT